MKNSIIKTGLLLLAVCGMQSCLKPNKNTYTDFSGTEDHIMILTSGLSNLGKAPANIVVAAAEVDTIPVELTVQLASSKLNATDMTVTVDIDDAKRVAYNTANGKNVLAFPDSMYSLPNKSVLIKAGTNFGKLTFYVYKQKVNLSKSFMLPISIKDAAGKKTTDNFNTQYFNIIGNPLAGAYKWKFRRYHGLDSSVALHPLSFPNADIVLLPASETKFTATSGYFIQPRYEVNFTNNAGVFSDFKVNLNEADVKSMADNGVTLTDGPNIILVDPIAKRFIFQYTVLTGGGPRYLIDEYTKP